MTESPLPEPPKPVAVTNRILRAGITIAIAHLTFKLLGIVQYKIIGYVCDDVTRDLFVFGLEGILGTLFFIGEEALGPAFLPVFMATREKDGEASAWLFGRTVLVLQTGIILIAMAVVFFFPTLIVEWGTHWDDPGKNPEFMQLGPLYAQYFVLGLLCMSLASTTYMLLNGYKRFFLAAFGDAAMKLCIVFALGGTFLWLRISHPGEAAKIEGETALVVFASGVIVGSVFKLLTHLLGLRDMRNRFVGRISLSDPAFRRFMILMAPLILGILFAKVRDYYNNQYVLSAVTEGLVANSAWSRKIFQALGFIVPYAVSIAMLPFFCELVDRDKKAELGAMITRSARLVLLLVMPLMALVVVLSLPITQVLFQGGKTSYEACLLIAASNQCYSLVLPAMALEYVFMQAFFANRKMASVVVIGMVFSALSMAISYVCIIKLGFDGMDALMAVALAMTISKTLKVSCLAWMMRWFLPCFPLRESGTFFLRIMIVTAVTGAAAWGVRVLYEEQVAVETLTGQKELLLWAGLDLVLAGAAGGIAAAVTGWLLCREDLQLVVAWARERICRRKTSGKE